MNKFMTNTTSTCSEKLRKLLGRSEFLTICFLGFIGIRLILILLVPVNPSSDAGWYFARAVTISTEGAFSESGIATAYWPVGYPAFLGLLFFITGPSLFVAQIANLALAACSFWLLYFLARRLFRSELIARCGVLLLTVYPNNIAYVPLTLSETLYTFLLLSACIILLFNYSWRICILIGIIFGLATLVKTQTILLAPALVFLAYCKKWSFKDISIATFRTMAIFVVVLAVVAPWTYRNYIVFEHFILVSTNGGMSLLSGNNPSVVGDYSRDYSDADPLFKQVDFSVMDQVAADRRARTLAIEWIKDNPGTFLGLIPKKFFRFWVPDGEAEWQYQRGTPWYDQYTIWFRLVRILNQVFYIVILIFFAVSIWKIFKEKPASPLYIGPTIAVFFTLLSLVFSGQSRYHFPVMPFIMIYAAWVIIQTEVLSKPIKYRADFTNPLNER